MSVILVSLGNISTTYAKYEAGELNIRASVLIELRKIYGCPYDEFFRGLDPDENQH